MPSFNKFIGTASAPSAIRLLAIALLGCAPFATVQGASAKTFHVYVAAKPLHKEKGESEKGNFYCDASFGAFDKDLHGQAQSKELWAKLSDRLCNATRLVTQKGDSLVIQEIYLADGKCPDKPREPDISIGITETKRRTQLVQDLLVLGKAKGVTLFMNTGATKVHCLSAAVTHNFSGDPSNTATNIQIDPAKDTTKNQLALTTGPEERWFLSVDGVLKGPKQLKYDAEKKVLSAKDKPDQVYIGINYLFAGDLYIKPALENSFAHDRFVGKLMLAPSKKPFDSVGLGVGYRLGLPGSKLSDGAFMIFAGSFWTKGDRLDGTEVAVDRRYTQSWRFGVSYGLNAATDWLK